MMQLDRAPAEKPTILRLNAFNYLDNCTQQVNGSSVFKPVSFSEATDLRTQEALIIHDLLHALLGYEGNYTRFSERYNRNSLHDRIHGPDHKVAKHLDVSLKTITKKLLRYGKYYSGLCAFSEIYTHPLFGKVNQRLCELIRLLLNQYRDLVIHLEHSFSTNSTFSLRTMDNELTRHFSDKLRHMFEITCSIHSLTEERNPFFKDATTVPDTLSLDLAGRGAKFDTFLESVKNDIRLNSSGDISSDVEPFPVCKGGLTLRVIQNRIYQFKGDELSSQFLAEVFETVSQDYLGFLNTWLMFGQIKDGFSDFFIKRNELPKNFFYSNMEKYWQELYVIRTDGLLDQFENKDIQSKILLTGKYLNIIRQCTDNAASESLPQTNVSCQPIESLFASDLVLKVNQFYTRANSSLLKLLFDGFYLGSFLDNLHQTFFLANSSKVDDFIGKKLHDLSRSKTSSSAVGPTLAYNEMVMTKDSAWEVADLEDKSIFSNIEILKILSHYQTFSVDTKSFYEIAEEILNIKSFSAEDLVPANEVASSAIRRIVTQSLQKRPDLSDTDKLVPAESFEDAIIAGVNVDVNLPFPLNLVLGENLIFEYQLMFKFQMMLKFSSKFIESVWVASCSSSVWRNKNHVKPVQKLILRSRILISRMKNFVNVMENHVSLSIVEANYQTLKTQVFKCRQWVNESRPATSKDVASSSNFLSEDTQFLMSHGSNNNDVFEEKISKNLKRQPQNVNLQKNADVSDMPTLSENIGFYLSNTLRDSMITDGNLLQCIRRLLNEVVDFASTVSRLKKSLILVNENLLREYSQNYPDNFGNQEFNEALLQQRVTRLNEIMTWNWSRFNNSLGEFTLGLQNAGAENPTMQSLAEKLALI